MSEYDDPHERLGDWTIATLRAHFESQIANLRLMLDERYETQTKALDKAFQAQQEAMKTALESAEKAVQVALISAEKAVTKAETAAEKRFESVNEFRAQLSDQATTFLSRAEAEVRLQSIADKVDTVETIVLRGVTQEQYTAAHEALYASVRQEHDALAEHKQYDITVQGKLAADMSNLRSRYAGVSVALGVVMTVLIVLVTVLQLTHK